MVIPKRSELLKRSKKTEADKAREAALKSKQSMANLDRSLKDMDVKVVIEIRQLNFAAVANLAHSSQGRPRNLMQISTDPIFVKMIKKGSQTGLEVLGVKFMT
jgi:hypothetical protein